MSILVLNAGSSSVKYALFDAQAQETDVAGVIEDATDPKAAVEKIVKSLGATGRDVRVVGHRVVHGGRKFRRPVVIDASVRREIDTLTELAPLHNPPALAAIDAASNRLPQASHIAVFDTAFYDTLAPTEHVYPLPYAWYEKWDIQRYGFHGISHAFCTARLQELSPGAERLIICHLGNGCSATAVHSGRAVATTMGLTPLEGLMMGTRCGSIDPGILLYLQQQHELSAAALEDTLNHKSGLLGVSGVGSDYRQVESAAKAGNARARLALDIYARRVQEAIGALSTRLGGIDALAFTAGVGEHADDLRARVCAPLGFIGVTIDPKKNTGARGDTAVHATEAHVQTWVLHTREELMIARQAHDLQTAALRDQ